MAQIVLTKVIDKEKRYYGFKLGGIVFGIFIGFIAWKLFNMIAFIVGFIMGYFLGAYLSGLVHRGMIQRWIYWNMPLKKQFGNKYLPSSHVRIFK